MSDFAYAYFSTELDKLSLPDLEQLFEKIKGLMLVHSNSIKANDDRNAADTASAIEKLITGICSAVIPLFKRESKNAMFESPFGNQTYETYEKQQSSDEILTYFLLFKEGFKKALTCMG